MFGWEIIPFRLYAVSYRVEMSVRVPVTQKFMSTIAFKSEGVSAEKKY